MMEREADYWDPAYGETDEAGLKNVPRLVRKEALSSPYRACAGEVQPALSKRREYLRGRTRGSCFQGGEASG